MTDRNRLDPEDSEEYAELVAFGLDSQATVVIVGAYQGVTAATVSELYGGPRVLAFEPQRWAFDVLTSRCREFPRVECFNFGLGVEDADNVEMGEFHTDACSFLSLPGQREFGTGNIREAGKVLDELGAYDIDLLLMNIEGYEYVLLPHLYQLGVLEMTRYLLIQWHRDYNESWQEAGIKQALAKTHRLRDTGPFDSWERVDSLASGG